MSTNYEVTAEREGKWWVFRIPELDTSGQARSLAEIDDEARGIISAWNDVPMEDVTVTVAVVGIDGAIAEWKAADDDDRRAREAAAAAAKRRRNVIVHLRTIGYTGADVAKVIGVSKQRVSQLEKAPKNATVHKIDLDPRGVGVGKPTVRIAAKVATKASAGRKTKVGKG